jgi:23S rRNA (uracil1939-C5)-methyltransferase
MPGVTSVLRHINAAPGSLVLGGSTFLLHGREYIQDSLGGLVFNLSAESFYQVNPSQTLALYQKALDYAGLAGPETVVDVYSGVGAIALFQARGASRVVGLELVPEAVEDARANAELNGIKNVEFHQRAVEKLLPRLVRRGLKPDVVVLDPPLRGCHIQVLETIAETGVPRVIYVSCYPGTLARDLAVLAGYGYVVQVANKVLHEWRMVTNMQNNEIVIVDNYGDETWPLRDF